MVRTAFITGITGQDGSYLAELLLEKGYQVFGLVRRLSKPNTENIVQILKNITLIEGDLHDSSSLNAAIRRIKPDEVYALASQSFVGTSWTQPVLTADVTGLGTLRLLEAIRQEHPQAKVYQASSSEQFGKVNTSPQNEQTPFHPRSPYGCAKVFAHNICVNYRESYGMHICCGILFNHESPRRGIEFVTKKIAVGVANILKGRQKYIELGNLDAKRDWGYAPEYVEAMWLMLQQEEPDDFVIATGETHSIKEFVIEALKAGDIDDDWHSYVQYNTPEHMRHAEVNLLCGDYSKARKKIKWEPRTHFKELVRIMVGHELNQGH